MATTFLIAGLDQAFHPEKNRSGKGLTDFPPGISS
jgi:hypothetical protein